MIAIKKSFLFQSFLVLWVIFYSGCDDATVVKYDETLSNVECLKLSIIPPDKQIYSMLYSLYKFDDSCKYLLKVSKKSDIVCNSNQNSSEKTFSNFPTGYLRFDVYKNHIMIYSYYRDLTDKVSDRDIKKAFLRVKEDILR